MSVIAMNSATKKIDPTSFIKDRLDWQRLDSIFNPDSKKMRPLVEEFGEHGVYQVVRTENKTDDLISENMGYIGKSKRIFGRVYCLKINKHNACNFIKRNEIAFNDIWVRFLFTENKEHAHDLESFLHESMREKYGYIFSWKEASAGNDGSILRIYEAIDKLTNREEAESVYSYARQRCVDLYLENLGSDGDKE